MRPSARSRPLIPSMPPASPWNGTNHASRREISAASDMSGQGSPMERCRKPIRSRSCSTSFGKGTAASPSCRIPSASARAAAWPLGRGSGFSSKMIAPSRVTRRARTCRLARSKKLCSSVTMASGMCPSTSPLVISAAASTRCAPALPVRSAMTSIPAAASRSVSGISAPRPFAMTKRTAPAALAARCGRERRASAGLQAERAPDPPWVRCAEFGRPSPRQTASGLGRSLRSLRNRRSRSSISMLLPPRPCSVSITARRQASCARPSSAAATDIAASRTGSAQIADPAALRRQRAAAVDRAELDEQAPRLRRAVSGGGSRNFSVDGSATPQWAKIEEQSGEIAGQGSAAA